jgi:signal transduction histidine kinase
MTIRFKVAALVAMLFAVLIVADLVIQEFVLMPRFVSLERAGARTSMTRIVYAVDRAGERLLLNDEEWSNWAELYRYMQDFNPAFISTYTTAEATTPLKVNLLMLVDRNGRVVFSAARNLTGSTPLDLDLAKLRSLPENFPWLANLTSGIPARGLVRTNRGVMMVAAAPIFDGSGGGRALGVTLMGRLLSTQLHEISTQAQATLAMRPASDRPASDRPASDRPLSDAPASDVKIGPDLIEDGEVTQVFHRYDDIYGQAAMTLQVDVPRSITSRGRAAILYSTLYLVAAAITILVLLLVVLNQVVLKRIGRVTRHAIAVGAGGDLTARLDFAGDDEIGRLAREFDRMVERVAESRRQLGDQSFQAGFAERAKGIMHNLGNAMTPLGVRLSMLADRLRGAPAADVAAAAGELTQDSLDAQRRADLTQFVQYGCEQIQSAVAQAQADAAVMERQASIVTSTLAEQRASAGNEHVLESVRLPELLAQTLDIVPDACRRRLIVETDDSWRAVGVVTVARTVLRLVLQNLIINAADAVREAGLGQGALRLTADIERGEGAPHLHIQCHDNGNGIAPEHLTHVFEKGYSTKSRSTNEGIGLHWCANAVRSLGGRIWAVSDGTGLGASMHVILPISQA